MKDRIEALMAEIEALSCKTEQEIEQARVRLLGKKGEITALFDEFRTVAPELKREFGQKLNVLKNAAAAKIEALKEVSTAMGLSAQEVESMLNLGGNTLEQAYKVLEIESTATDDEVKAAYRKLALKHHPDRVATLGEDVKKAAEEKFQQINNAKEMIYKARGMK